MNERLVAILMEGKVLCPYMAALGYPKDPQALPCICEITTTRKLFISTTKEECYANGQCLVFSAMPVEASEEQHTYDQRRA